MAGANCSTGLAGLVTLTGKAPSKAGVAVMAYMSRNDVLRHVSVAYRAL